MSYDQVSSITRELRSGLAAASDSVSLGLFLTNFISLQFKSDKVLTRLIPSGEIFSNMSAHADSDPAKNKVILSAANDKMLFEGHELESPLFISDVQKSRAPQKLLNELIKKQCKSFAALLISKKDEPIFLIEIYHSQSYYKWRKDNMFLLEQICSLVEVILLSKGNGRPKTAADTAPLLLSEVPSVQDSYQRLARYGNLLFIKISPAFQIMEILGDTKKILGIEPEDIIKNQANWQRYIDAADLKRLRRNFARMRFMQQEFSDEINISLNNNIKTRIIFVQVIPIYDENKNLLFWEGFAIDITDKRKAEAQLLVQSKRIEALYEVAQSTQIYHDPSLVMLKGLRSVMKATNSDAGLGCFHDTKSGHIEIAALEGLSQYFMQEVEKRIQTSTLIHMTIEQKESLNFKNIQEEPLALVDVVRKEGLKATLVVPLIYDGKVTGVLVLYRRDSHSYEQKDIDLVNAAATQIAIASRQAEYFIAEKQQAESMSLLYRISHELSKYTNPKEIAQHSFPLIQKHFACKRMWFGVLNEQATHIMGMAGFGPAVRRRIIDIQIELYLRHDFLDEALSNKRAVLVKENQEMECSGLNALIKRLNLGAFVILPLVALNQVVGVIILEPSISSEAFILKRLPILNRIGSEIATTILARRFENKIAEADKMRMAGLLASGVAHNFNNLLQAIMGQASLLEMQLTKDTNLSRSARMIVEAAGKGAGLINQLLNFSNVDSQLKREVVLNEIFEESMELYKSIVGSGVQIVLRIPDGLPKIELDYAQFQQLMSNLLVNAKEAVAGKDNGKIEIKVKTAKLLSGEVDPELAPGEYIRVDVEDNGVGMEEEQLRRCFEPFYSGKNINHGNDLSFSGSGLGLSYAYSIMKQHGGLITVRSQFKQGTVFSLYFPLPKKVIELIKPASDMHNDQENRVFFCELENTIERTMKPIFESSGLKSTVLPVNSKLENYFDKNNEHPAALIMDVDRESFHTIPFLQEIHKRFPKLLIVTLTNDARRWSNILSAFKALYVVSKPLNVWGIHALARKIVNYNINLSLREKVSVERGEEAQQNADEQNPPGPISDPNASEDNKTEGK